MQSQKSLWTVRPTNRANSKYESTCGVRENRSTGKMTIHAQKFFARIFGGRFKRGELLLGRWGVLGERYEANKVYLDFDMGRRSPRVTPIFVTFRAIGIRTKWVRFDRTRKGWHVILCLNTEISPSQTIALQAILGSDKRRETLNLMRVMEMERHGATPFWRKRWNLLYERKLK